MRIATGWTSGPAYEAPPGLVRGRAVEADAASDEEREWLGLDDQHAARPDLLRAFERIHRGLVALAPISGLVAPIAVDGHRIVRPSLHERTYAGWSLPEDIDVLRRVIGHLWPAIRHVGPHLLAALHPRDIGVRGDGELVFAPCGLVTPRGRIASDPYHAPTGTTPSTNDASLAYSFGMALGSLITGKEPSVHRRHEFFEDELTDQRVVELLSCLTAGDADERLKTLESIEGQGPVRLPDVMTVAEPNDDMEQPENVESESSGMTRICLTTSREALRDMASASREALAAECGLPLPFLQMDGPAAQRVQLFECDGIGAAKRLRDRSLSLGVTLDIVRDAEASVRGGNRGASLGAGVVIGIVVSSMTGPAVGIATGALSAIVAQAAFRRPALPLAVWRTPPGAEDAVSLCVAVRRGILSNRFSGLGDVLLRDAIGELERSLVYSSNDMGQIQRNAEALRGVHQQAVAAQEEVGRVGRSQPEGDGG